MCASPENQTSNAERICLFGGTFDPIHNGHTHIASAAQKAMQLDRVIFLPCKRSPHKMSQTLASEHQRLEMCKLATADLPWAKVDDYDLTAPEPSYSWRTAEIMKARFPHADLFWLMGSDQWDSLPKWSRHEHLSTLVEFIVFKRGHSPKKRKGMVMHAIEGDHPASATQIRESAASNQLKDSWLNTQVSRYIQNHQIYGI